MPIKVDISLSSGGRFKPVSSHTLHEKRITIGRDAECTLSLEDTQKHVSRKHAEVEQQDDCYWIKVVSKVNPISVNGKRYSYGERVPVVEGDQVHVGLYKLEIVEADATSPKPAPTPIVADETEETTIAPQVAAPPAAKAAGETTRPTNASSPALPESLDNAAEEEATYVPPVKAPAPQPPVAAAVPSKSPPASIPENIDDEVTYIPPMWARHAGNRAGAAASQAADLEDLTGIVRPPAPDAPKSPAKSEAPNSDEALTPTAAADVDFDLSDAFEEVATMAPAVTPKPSSPPAAFKPPEVEENFSEDVTYVRRPTPAGGAIPPVSPSPVPKATPPSALAPSHAEPPKSPNSEHRSALAEIQARIAAKTGSTPPAARPAQPGADKAVNAFLEGAGLSHLQVTDTEAFMRQSGEMARAAVGGVLTLLMDRAAARKELGTEIDAGGEENPLTSLANPEEVIAFLFDPKRPAIGNSDPTQAFSGAVADLRLHQAALISAMRAAIMTTLLRIDPKKLEREHGANLGMLNITRKSKLWDLSVAQHEQLAREIEQDFAVAFGQEILAAFDEQARKPRGG